MTMNGHDVFDDKKFYRELKQECI